MEIREVKMPHPNFTEEFILNDNHRCHMPKGYRRTRIEYGFECGCPEGVIYWPPDVTYEQMDKVEELLQEIWGSVISVREVA